MQLDTRIPLGVQQISLADILKNVEAIKSSAQERAYRAHMMQRQSAQDQRDDQFRSAAADYLLAGSGQGAQPPVAAPGDQPGAPPPPTVAPDMSRATPAPYYDGQDALAPLPDSAAKPSLASTLNQPGVFAPSPSAGNSRQDAFRRMVLADPKEALAARAAQLKDADGQMDVIARLAGSAYDQPSYEGALQRANSMGLDVSHLPRQYDPRMVNQVLNEALSAKERLAAERADLGLEYKHEDMQVDNERADENLQSLEGYRSGQIANTRRGQNMTDSRVRGSAAYNRKYGQGGAAGGPPKNENGLYTSIMSKWTAGEPVNAQEREFVRAYELRHSPRGRGRGRMGGGGTSGAMGAPQSAAPVHVSSIAQARALPPGTLFVGPDGVTRRR